MTTTRPVQRGTWVTLDLSDAFGAAADGIVTYALTTTDGTAVRFSAPVTHFLVTVDGSQHRAESAANGVVYTGSVPSVVASALRDLGAAGGGTVEFAAGTFDMGSSWLDLDDNVVRDCVISGVPSDGIELLAASNNRIEQCTITDVGGHGVQMTKASSGATQIVDNTV